MIRLLTIKQAAPILSMAEITMRRLLRQGVLPHHKIGSRYLFAESDIEEYLAVCKVAVRRQSNPEATV